MSDTSYTYDTYGFSGYDKTNVDDRHLLSCPGCTACASDWPGW